MTLAVMMLRRTHTAEMLKRLLVLQKKLFKVIVLGLVGSRTAFETVLCSNFTNWCRQQLLIIAEVLFQRLKACLGVSSSCGNVRADFLHWSGPIELTGCLLFRLLFSLGIPVWEVPPIYLRGKAGREPLAPGSFIIISSACRLSVKGQTPG